MATGKQPGSKTRVTKSLPTCYLAFCFRTTFTFYCTFKHGNYNFLFGNVPVCYNQSKGH